MGEIYKIATFHRPSRKFDIWLMIFRKSHQFFPRPLPISPEKWQSESLAQLLLNLVCRHTLGVTTMRFLFRKRIKLFPGISVNLSKSEVGTSFAANYSSIIKGGGLRKAAIDHFRPGSRRFFSKPYLGWSTIVSLRGWVLLLLVALGGFGLLA